MNDPSDAEYEQRVRSRRYSSPTISETGALLRLLDAERARADAAEARLMALEAEANFWANR